MKKEYAVNYRANGQEDVYFVDVDRNGLTNNDIKYSVTEQLKGYLKHENNCIPNDFEVTGIDLVI